jgi:hypothetical protein
MPENSLSEVVHSAGLRGGLGFEADGGGTLGSDVSAVISGVEVDEGMGWSSMAGLGADSIGLQACAGRGVHQVPGFSTAKMSIIPVDPTTSDGILEALSLVHGTVRMDLDLLPSFPSGFPRAVSATRTLAPEL